MTKLRSVLFVIYLVLTGVVFGTFFLPALISRQVTHALARTWAKLILVGLKVICGLGYRFEGRQRLPRGPGLVVAKHSSMFETIVLMAELENACFVLKKELSQVPIAGWYARRAGFVFIDRNAGASAMRAMIAGAKKAVVEGRQVVIFPEGSRSGLGGQLPYQPGVAALSRALDLPPVPVAHNAAAYWHHPGIEREPGTAVFEVLPPLPKGLSRKALLPALEAAIEPATRALESAARARQARA